MIPMTGRKIVFVDVFSGTGSMSNVAKQFHPEIEVIRLDFDPSAEADYKVDILDVGDGHEFIKRLKRHTASGDVILFHVSPPCNEFSTMNTRGGRDIDGAMRVVEKAYGIATSFATAWVFENPAPPGLLWEQPFSKKHFKDFCDVSYCCYGHVLKKQTRFAFSHPAIMDLFTPRTCPGPGLCNAMTFNEVTGRHVHATWERVRLDNRIAIPSQLCFVLVNALIKHSASVVEITAEDAPEDETMYAVESILDARFVNPLGAQLCLEFKVRWSDPFSNPEEDTWEPCRHVYTNAALTEFLGSRRWRAFKKKNDYSKFESQNPNEVEMLKNGD